MRPNKLNTLIFLDGANIKETQDILSKLGFLDGQTTNPTLVAKNPSVLKKIQAGKKFSQDEILSLYRDIVVSISKSLPQGSVSIEVIANEFTTAEEMFEQAQKMNKWIHNAHIKLPTNTEGLKAAQLCISKGIKINMTLCFTQEQAAAVHIATKGAQIGDVFISPFIGRLDDINKNGMDLIKNILKMYQKNNSHVQVLAASVRTMEHFLEAIRLNANIITAPYSVLKIWAERNLALPNSNFIYPNNQFDPTSYKNLDLTKSWRKLNISSKLTEQGIKRFADDWNNLIH